MNIGGDLEFAHRLNTDGTFDSICMSCFLTIRTAENEPSLAGQEKIHKCDATGAHTHLAAKNVAAADH